MIIKKMTAWFGTLEGASLELGEGLNVIYAPNESGKSTWCAFIRAMLYGVDTGQRARQGQQPDKKKYLPWSGAPMSGSMDVLTAEGPVTLRRWTERAGQPMQAFSAAVTGTDDPAPGLTAENAGDVLTGAPREVFERSAFIHQAGLGLTSDPELEKRFAAIVSAGDEEQSFSETDGRLRAWQRHRRSGRRGAIPELEGEIAQVGQELDRIGAAGRDVDALDRELAAAQERQTELTRRMEAAREAARKKALADYRAAKAETESRAAALAAAQEEKVRAAQAVKSSVFGAMGPEKAAEQVQQDMDALTDTAGALEALPKNWMPVIPPAVAGALWLGAASVFWPNPVAIIAGGAVFLGAAVAAWLWRRRILDRRYALEAARRHILDGYDAAVPEDIRDRLEEYEDMWADAQDAARAQARAERDLAEAQARQKAAEEPVLNGLDFVHGDSEAARASRAVTEGRERIESLRERRAMAEGRVRALGDEMVLRSDLAAQTARKEELERQERALALAAESMERADMGLREKFSPMVADRAAALFARLTDGRYDEITLARDLSARTRRAGDAVGRESDYLSQGARDQLYLALRLAVCALALPAERACPIILDDALAAFDQERMGRALELLKELAGERQVLLFSCHEREREYFAGDSGVTSITL